MKSNDEIIKELKAFVPDGSRVAVMWLGSFDQARAVLNNCSTLRRLYLVENNEQRLQDLSQRAESSGLLKDKRVKVVFIGEGRVGEIFAPEFSRDILLFAEGKVGVYISPEYAAIAPSFAKEVMSAVLDFTRMVISSAATRAVRGWHMMCNAVLNAAAPGARCGVDLLSGLAQNKAVVIVGAGPSLDRNIAELADSDVVVVACDSAWRSLARNGVIPDLVVTTDGDEVVWRFFAELSEQWHDVPVLTMLRGSWTVPRYYKGTLLTGRSAGEDIIEKAVETKIPVLDVGQCVGHAVFETAKLLGADPVIMIGFDLGYSGDSFHAKDMAVPYFAKQAPEQANLVSVPGVDGTPVKTDVSMLMYLREFERRIAGFDGVVFDATEGGALIRGTKQATLKSLLSEIPPNKPDIAKTLKSGIVSLSRVNTPDTQWLSKHSGELLLEINRISQALTDRISGGQQAFPSLSRFEKLINFLSCSYGMNIFARFHLEWEDWVFSGAAYPVPDSLVDAAKAYLGSLAVGARLVRESALIFPALRSGRNPKQVVAFSRDGGNPAYSMTLEMLSELGYQVGEYRNDCDDVPQVWRALNESRAGLVLMSDSAVYPSVWAMPGCACIDVKGAVRKTDDLYANWLPGYGVVCSDDAVFRHYKDALPSDRRAWLLRDKSGFAEYIEGLLKETAMI